MAVHVNNHPTNDRLPIFERWAVRYDQSVQTDQGIFASYDAMLAEVVRAAGVEAGMCVLELGVGTGNLALKLAALGCEVWGVDFSPAMLAIAREKAPQVRLVQMDLTGVWPAALQQRFDRIVANLGERRRMSTDTTYDEAWTRRVTAVSWHTVDRKSMQVEATEEGRT